MHLASGQTYVSFFRVFYTWTRQKWAGTTSNTRKEVKYIISGEIYYILPLGHLSLGSFCHLNIFILLFWLSSLTIWLQKSE